MRAKERAEKRLAAARSQQEKVNQARAEAALQRAMARLKAAGQKAA
ncbi:MAG TPA: ATP synthase delta/epsilon chain alpha-helix domain-containing protein [Desulfurivibrionaceae bacterium]|nr:ATP synthase delta/epsilon chain alpha-helix domain-containing protein [Desulfurivibrionaceae bacterium]